MTQPDKENFKGIKKEHLKSVIYAMHFCITLKGVQIRAIAVQKARTNAQGKLPK